MRICSGLEKLVIRLSHSDPGPGSSRLQWLTFKRSTFSVELISYKKEGGVKGFFFFLEDLTPFPSCSCLVERSKLPPSGCTHNVQDTKVFARIAIVWGGQPEVSEFIQ